MTTLHISPSPKALIVSLHLVRESHRLNSFRSPCFFKPSKLLSLSPKTGILLSTSSSIPQFSIRGALDRPRISPASTSPLNQQQELSIQIESGTKESSSKSFWAAVTLIIGTAVGPGMLGLPSATIKSGTIPSTVAITLSWIYVVSSIILVAELSFAVMRRDNVEEVSFTSLATAAFGPNFGALVALVYACLSFSLLVACVSGIGSLVMQQFPSINPLIAQSLLPGFVAIVIGFFPFKAIDATNKLLCSLMLLAITALVLIGVSVGRSSLLSSLSFASWSPGSVMPAIPLTVLTLGFHVVTPFVCSMVGDSMYDARRAILFGGAVPLAMVLSWNAVILGLAGSGSGKGSSLQPIELLLSVNSSALPAVQGFAFTALATSLIGYAVSFPKQLIDTMRLIGDRFQAKQLMTGYLDGGSGVDLSRDSRNDLTTSDASSSWNGVLVTWLVLLVPVFIASFFPTAFSKALDFAGVYANCFLFGILPPAMAWIHRSSTTCRSTASREHLLPGGRGVLILLFVIAMILGFWH